jgi:hypothetical protein
MLDEVIAQEQVSSPFNIVEDIRPTQWVLLGVPDLIETEV